LISKILRQASAGIVVAVAVVAAAASADDIRLPDLGSPADAILSKSNEAQIGRSIMRDIRNSGMIVEDPQVADYINAIGHRLAVQANDGDYSFSF
jgi:predicted Zn-dependent protease